MPYEALSKAIAYVSCLSTFSLFLTSMAIAAINVTKIMPADMCAPTACTAAAVPAIEPVFGGLMSPTHIEAVAAALWSTKI
ncbi:MAG: hypothetical protein ACRCS9_14455 [Hyphomicrobium sp.]